jgi:hypothetical protein
MIWIFFGFVPARRADGGTMDAVFDRAARLILPDTMSMA